MPELSDFTHGPGWKLTWTKNPDPNPTYPLGNLLLIIPSVQGPGMVDLIWMDACGKRRSFQGISFETTDGGRLYSKKPDYEVTVTMAIRNGIKTIQGSVVPTHITPEAGTWGADANGGLKG